MKQRKAQYLWSYFSLYIYYLWKHILPIMMSSSSTSSVKLKVQGFILAYHSKWFFTLTMSTSNAWSIPNWMLTFLFGVFIQNDCLLSNKKRKKEEDRI